MKKNWFLFLTLTLFFVIMLRQPAIADTPKYYTEIEFPPLKEVQIPNYEKYELENGMSVFLMEDHRLPLVGGTALIRTGSRLEPEDKIGLADITGTVMRLGGTVKHSPDELNQFLENRAASIETSIGLTAGSASFDTLTEDLDSVFDIFAEVIQSPAFPQDKLDLVKNQQKGDIARRNDDPESIVDREFNKIIYGADSPYARVLEYSNLKAIQQADLKAFHDQQILPQNTILGIVGDFDPKVMKAKIQAKFGNWNPHPEKTANPIPKVTTNLKTGNYFVEQSQLNQSSILVGHLGGILKDKNYPALSVMNEVLSGFGGRLFNEIRSKQGLAYSVYGYWNPNYDYPGLFIAGGQTRSSATVPFIQSLVKEIEKIQETPITEEELTDAKDSILNAFVFNFAQPVQTLSRLMRYAYYDYPEDFIFQYQKGVKATTTGDIQRVAQNYLKPKNLVTLVVGNSQEINPPLTTLGKVQSIDITIPSE